MSSGLDSYHAGEIWDRLDSVKSGYNSFLFGGETCFCFSCISVLHGVTQTLFIIFLHHFPARAPQVKPEVEVVRISKMSIDVFCLRMIVSAVEQKQPSPEPHYPARCYAL